MSQLATDMELHFLRAQVRTQADTIKAYEQVFANAIQKARQAQLEIADTDIPVLAAVDPRVPGMTPGMRDALLDNTAAAFVK